MQRVFICTAITYYSNNEVVAGRLGTGFIHVSPFHPLIYITHVPPTGLQKPDQNQRILPTYQDPDEPTFSSEKASAVDVEQARGQKGREHNIIGKYHVSDESVQSFRSGV